MNKTTFKELLKNIFTSKKIQLYTKISTCEIIDCQEYWFVVTECYMINTGILGMKNHIEKYLLYVLQMYDPH